MADMRQPSLICAPPKRRTVNHAISDSSPHCCDSHTGIPRMPRPDIAVIRLRHPSLSRRPCWPHVGTRATFVGCASIYDAYILLHPNRYVNAKNDCGHIIYVAPPHNVCYDVKKADTLAGKHIFASPVIQKCAEAGAEIDIIKQGNRLSALSCRVPNAAGQKGTSK